MNHTPTPWKIHWSMGPHGEHHNIVRADDEDIGRVGFVEAFAPTDGDMEKEGYANARLIAAAPDILEALEEARDMLKAANVTGIALVKIEAAIAKAHES